jgi:hypothetical protein
VKFSLPIDLAEWIFSLRLFRRPKYLAKEVPESPSSEELQAHLIFLEVRGGFLKWAHMSCPKCSDHIQLPLAGKDRWKLKFDFLRRPTLAPSIWETQSCGAHFFIRKGEILWCNEARHQSQGDR